MKGNEYTRQRSRGDEGGCWGELIRKKRKEKKEKRRKRMRRRLLKILERVNLTP